MILAIITVTAFLLIVGFIFEDDILEAKTEDKKKAEQQSKIDDLLGRNRK